MDETIVIIPYLQRTEMTDISIPYLQGTELVFVSYGWQKSVFHICRQLSWGRELWVRNVIFSYLHGVEMVMWAMDDKYQYSVSAGKWDGVVSCGKEISFFHTYKDLKWVMWAIDEKYYLYSTSSGNCFGNRYLGMRNIIVIPDLQECLWIF